MRLQDKLQKKYQQDGLASLLMAAVRRVGVKTVDAIKYQLWRVGILNFDDIYPSEYYEDMDRKEAMADSDAFADQVITMYDPESMIDLGCGVGRFLYPFWEREVSVYGVDAAQKAIDNAIVPKERVEQFDLRDTFSPEEQADVVICTEVVEHLPESAADNIVQSIANSAPVGIVTAAKPRQGGKHHVNEQPPEYWIQKFESVGMEYDEQASQTLQDRIEAEELDWLTENLMVFEAKDFSWGR